MPIQQAVLALLADRPSHGYELHAAFERAVGPQWGTLNVGQLYQVLSRLAADGLITSTREPQPNRPDRLIHTLTPQGAEELATWLAQPTVRQPGYRDDFFLRLIAVTRRGDSTAVLTLIEGQRRYLLGELRNLRTLRPETTDDPITGLLVDAARLHVEADLTLLDHVEQRTTDLVAAATAPPAAEPAPPPARRRVG
jgi:DNA-binding PadR family transcriptional regulator